MDISLPSPSLDPIIRLHDYYFQNAELMFENVEKLFAIDKRNGRLSQNNVIKLQSYAKLWFSTLYVVVEGFQCHQVKNYFTNTVTSPSDKHDLMLNVHWNSIQYKIEQLGGQLKSFRNVTFHFQEKMTRLEEKRSSFLLYEGRHKPLDWARDLHREMQMFFNEYRPRAAALHMHQQLLATGAKPEHSGP